VAVLPIVGVEDKIEANARIERRETCRHNTLEIILELKCATFKPSYSSRLVKKHAAGPVTPQ
jgi:hypothetical protein